MASLRAWFAALKVRRLIRQERLAHRREHRAMGVCPDCGAYLGAHRMFRHGADRST